MNRTLLFAALVGVTAALPVQAQGRARGGDDAQSRDRGSASIPPGQRPSPGMCRIWIDGLPAGQQPAQTDCATARRQVPANGRVIEGTPRSADDRNSRWPIGLPGRDSAEDRRDDDDRGRGRQGRDDDDDDDDGDSDDDDDNDRSTRRFIDRNGLECEEKAVTKNGRRSYDLKCREPKGARKPNARRPRTDDGRTCIDANRDGRCDVATGRTYPTTLPDMVGAIVFGQGQRTDDVSRWLGDGRYQVRYTDQDRDRRPERVRWLDGDGSLLQEWLDTNRDGRADVVNIYSAGKLVQTLGGR